MRPKPLLLCLFLFFTAALPAQLPAGFVQELITEGLDPTGMTQAPDGRIFITEKSGRVRIVKDDVLLEDPFLELEVDNYNERGLMSIALDPDFDRNNYVYLFYTVPEERFNRVSRFTANGDYVLANSEMVLFELDPLGGAVHNGGGMQFGADGKLYFTSGDGAQSGKSQDLSSLAGKIFRINSDGSIPKDNPFFNQLQGGSRAIFAYGFRNPYGFAIHPQNGLIFANDVGSNRWEEINEVIAGKNYGWSRVEGTFSGTTPPENYQDPLYAYGRGDGCSVTMGTFYSPENPSFPPRYLDKYLFADYCDGYIKVLDPTSGEIEETFITGIQRPIAGLVSSEGHLYYLNRKGSTGSVAGNTSTSQGQLWKVSFIGSGEPFIGLQPRDRLTPVGEDLELSVQAFGQPPLRYQWFAEGSPLPGDTLSSLLLENISLDWDGKSLFCQVRNAEGQVNSDTLRLRITPNQRPVPTITSPLPGDRYSGGDVLFFEGLASDPEEGALAAEQLEWRIDFHHDDHTHPALNDQTGILNGFFEIPIFGEVDTNVWYRVLLTATDTQGLVNDQFVDVYPNKVDFRLESQPSGLTLSVDGRAVSTPSGIRSVHRVLRSLEAPLIQERNDSVFVFSHWEGGDSSLVQVISAEEGLTRKAHYRGFVPAIGVGTGLRGTYLRTRSLDPLEGDTVFTRLDSLIAFDWGALAPQSEGMPDDNFSIVWSGYLLAMHDGPTTFYLGSDDGSRLWIDEELVIDNWRGQSYTVLESEVELEAGKFYPIKVAFFDLSGFARVDLKWSNIFMEKQLVPARQLYPDLLTTDQQSAPVPGVQLEVFPNPVPATGAWLKVAGELEDEVQLWITDLNGQTVSSLGIRKLNKGALLPLPIGKLASGIYFLNVKERSNAWIWSIKLVKP